MGEFIFDDEWSDFAKQKGIRYYPKLLVGVPFSPVTCQKILFEPAFRQGMDEERVRDFRLFVGKILQSIVKDNHLSSAHINFVTDEEARDLAGDIANTKDNKSILQSVVHKFTNKDYIRKTTLQYHWFNNNTKSGDADDVGGYKKYTSFDDYLNCFKSKKRITIKRERRSITEQNVRLDAIVGKNIRQYPGLVERMYEIYKSTVDKMFWGRLYFTQNFFEMLVESDFVENLVFMCARFNGTDADEENGVIVAQDVFAGTVNVVKDGVFYGRYWGCLPDYDIKNLHFEVCYWSAIEYCIGNGLDKMEPGAGGGGEYHSYYLNAFTRHLFSFHQVSCLNVLVPSSLIRISLKQNRLQMGTRI